MDVVLEGARSSDLEHWYLGIKGWGKWRPGLLETLSVPPCPGKVGENCSEADLLSPLPSPKLRRSSHYKLEINLPEVDTSDYSCALPYLS